MRSDPQQFTRQFYDEVRSLSKEAQKYVWEKTQDLWIEEHTSTYTIVPDEPEKTVLALSVGEMQREPDQIDKKISDLSIPPGMGEYATAKLEAEHSHLKMLLRSRAAGVVQILERVKSRCVDYASRVETQRRMSRKTSDFLATIQNQVNNYFAAHHEETFRKLQKASELVQSDKTEDLALALTAVRRAMKSIAEHFYPSSDKPHMCSDGKSRVLGEDSYLNRLEEFCNTLPGSTSSELLKAELSHLSLFARRLNDIASKGVHAEVTKAEAHQGLLGLYLFTSNLIGRLERP